MFVMRKLFFLLFLSVFQVSHAQSHFSLGKEPELMINNRILANVNGKPISVIDVMKKMDVVFYRRYPEYRDNVTARSQFYQNTWKDVLQQLVDKELIVADAAEGKLEVSNGDIRQELETMFGPNIISNLDRIGLSFEEAWEIVKDEIIIRRMLYFRVNSKAIKHITPQVIYEAYEKYAKNHPRETEWHYHVISIQDKNSENCEKIGAHIHNLLTQDHVPLNEIKPLLSELELITETTKVNVSDEFSVKENEISASHKEILSQLKPDSYTEPVVQKSRSGANIYRIFYLKDTQLGGQIPFHELENQVISELTEQAIEVETESYLKRLRRHFHFDAQDVNRMASNDFQPFVMK